MKKKLLAFSSFFISLPLSAATPIDLAMHAPSFLLKTKMNPLALQLQETSRELDHNHTLHVRVQQTYEDILVFGGDAVIHYPNQTHNTKPYHELMDHKTMMNGIVYHNLRQDLRLSTQHVFTEANALKAKQKAIDVYSHDKTILIKDVTASPLIYIDHNHEAHWTYQISFLTRASLKIERPTYIIDAQAQTVYRFWNDYKSLKNVLAGGYVGNHKTGKKELGSETSHLPALTVKRDKFKKICFMKNSYAHIKNFNTEKTMTFDCKEKNPEHNLLYWNGNHDQVETTWSPSNDVMFGITVGVNMFQEWYHIPILKKNKHKKAAVIKVIVHDPDENAGWDPYTSIATFGDSIGSKDFNPFTQLDTVVHELAHGFTEQHSKLFYFEQSGGVDESFSDIAGIAAEYYIYGKTDFLVGLGDLKDADKALRYMSQPSLDCKGRKPGNFCSIDHYKQYDHSLSVHFSSGLFNRAFYILAHTKNWNAKKAFDIMVQANRFYWTSRTTFAEAACGVVKAARDYHYHAHDVKEAFKVVGIKTKC